MYVVHGEGRVVREVTFRGTFFLESPVKEVYFQQFVAIQRELPFLLIQEDVGGHFQYRVSESGDVGHSV